MAVPDTSVYIESFGGYVYGDFVAELREEVAYKLSLTEAAGVAGKRIGENFQDIRRLIVSGTISEDSDNNTDGLPLRLLVQNMRYAHRAEVGKARLYTNSAADSRPAEFVMAAVEALNGLQYESPMIETDFEISFVSEPEIWYDDPQTVNLKQNATGSGDAIGYSVAIPYVGPASSFYADAEGLPLISLVVASVTSGHEPGTVSPATITITNDDGQEFILYPDEAATFLLDSYEEGIRKGTTWAGGDIYELADYDQFLFLRGAASDAGVTQTVSVTCAYCTLTSASAVYYPRHW